MIRVVGCVLALAAVCLPTSGTQAGECTEGDKAYVSKLETWAQVRPLDRRLQGQVHEAFHCLTPELISPWAGPIAAQHFKNLHQSPFRQRVVAAAVQYLSLPLPSEPFRSDLAFDAAQTLAMFGEQRVDGYDLLSFLVERAAANHERLPYSALASMGDPRLLSLLRATYDSLSSVPPSLRIANEKWNLINCLYHVSGDSALDLVRQIAAADPDSTVRARAQHVVQARTR